jgi:hypothetical protein
VQVGRCFDGVAVGEVALPLLDEGQHVRYLWACAEEDTQALAGVIAYSWYPVLVQVVICMTTSVVPLFPRPRWAADRVGTGC